jgi:uncharacterized membrane protein
MTSSLSTIARGDSSGIVASRRAIVRDAGDWRALWMDHAGPETPVPEIDFGSRMVAAVFAGERPTPGYEIEITGTGRAGRALVLAVTERSPAAGTMAAQMLVSPFHIVTLPRYDGDVRFADGTDAAGIRPSGRSDPSTSSGSPRAKSRGEPVEGRDPGSVPRQAWDALTLRQAQGHPEPSRGVSLSKGGIRQAGAPSESGAAGPEFGAMLGLKPVATSSQSARAPASTMDPASSTGLDPNFAAALAYLAGPFSGVLILLVERRSGYVRFHAWQAIVGLGGLGALAVLVLVLSFLTLLLSPFVFTVLYRLSEIIAIVWVVAWIVCLVKAFTGHAWKMPVAGRYAKRLATKRS